MRRLPLIPVMITLTVLLFLIQSCKKEQVRLDEKFVNLFIELNLATLGNSQNQERAAKVRKAILKNYNVTASDFSKQLEILKSNPEIWKDFQEKVIANLEKIEKKHKGE